MEFESGLKNRCNFFLRIKMIFVQGPIYIRSAVSGVLIIEHLMFILFLPVCVCLLLSLFF